MGNRDEKPIDGPRQRETMASSGGDSEKIVCREKERKEQVSPNARGRKVENAC